MKPQVPAGYKVKIYHYRDPLKFKAYDERTRQDPIQAVTVAQLIREDTGRPIVVGKAYCSVKDQFNKKKARDIATGRAIKKFHELSDGRRTTI